MIVQKNLCIKVGTKRASSQVHQLRRQYVTMCWPMITASSRHVSFSHYLKPEKQAVELSGQPLLQTGLPLDAAEQLPPLLRCPVGCVLTLEAGLGGWHLGGRAVRVTRTAQECRSIVAG